MKKIILSLIILIFSISNAQVGIGTITPNGLLDIAVTNQASPTSTDGLLIPRVLAFPSPVGIAQNGMLVFLTTAFSGNKVGLYFYDFPSLTWKWVASGNNVSPWVNNNANARIDVPLLSNGTSARSVGNNFAITDAGNLGIGTTNPTTKLDVVGNLNVTTGLFYGGATSPANLEIIRAMPIVTNDVIEIGNFDIINGAHNFRLTATVSLGNFSVAKSYLISAKYNQTNNVWQVLRPESNTGIFNADDFDIDINVNLKVASLRIRRKAGVIAGNISIRLENTGSTTDVFTQTNATASVTAPTTTFNNNLTQNFWNTIGNTGTTAGTNFVGTNDAQDLVLKTNNIQRLKIDNSTNATTTTAGDVEVGDANSGTIRANKELVLRESGDVFGNSILRLRNRNGENGAIFETTSSPDLVDFIFKTGNGTKVSNIRFEARTATTSVKIAGNTTEWQFGQPDSSNGGATLVVGAFGTGSNSAFRIGNLGIGNVAPTEKLDVTGNIKFSGAFMPNNLPGTSGQVLVSSGVGLPPTWDANPAKPFTTTTAAAIYNVLATDHTVRLATNATGVLLPSPVTNNGKIFVIIGKNGLLSIPFTTAAGTIVDDSVILPITTIIGGQRYIVQSDGTNWIVIGR